MKRLVLMLIMVALSGCGLIDGLNFGSPNHYMKTEAFEGVIFTVENASQFRLDRMFGEESVEYWMPTEEQILTLEADLVPFLQEELPYDHYAYGFWENLSDYQRQYVGFTFAQGKPLIYGNYFCADAQLDYWQESFVIVLDGGECFFQMVYDPAERTFWRPMINGFA